MLLNLTGILRAKRPWATKPSRRPAPARKTKLNLESLEERQMMTAGPGNLWVNKAWVHNDRMVIIGSPEAPTVAVGEIVHARGAIGGFAVPRGTMRVEARLDSDSASQGNDYEIVRATPRIGNRWLGGFGDFVVGPNSHTLELTINTDRYFTEASESDNVARFSLPIANDNPRFVSPIGGVAYRDWAIVEYVDLQRGPGLRDYRGGQRTYDNHTGGDHYDHSGVDYALPHFGAMDRGVQVRAAAAGTVVEMRDGLFDRNVDQGEFMNHNLDRSDRDFKGNYVVIDHGNGWRTMYFHLRAGSFPKNLAVGTQVSAGKKLGLVGSSGNSDGPHLHFEVTHFNNEVDTFVDPPRYWIDPPPYTDDVVSLLDMGFSKTPPASLATDGDRPQDDEFFVASRFQAVTSWAFVHGVKPGEAVEFRWIHPGGDESRPFEVHSNNNADGLLRGVQDTLSLPYDAQASQAFGVWRVQIVHQGRVLGEDTFTLRPQVQFDVQQSSTVEGDKVVHVELVLSEASHQAVNVAFDVSGSAFGMRSQIRGMAIDVRQFGADYTLDQRRVTFAPGETRKSIDLYLLDDSVWETNETVELALRSADNALLGDPNRHTLTIVDNDRPRRARDYNLQAGGMFGV